MTDKELIAEAAILYYEKNLTQQEISKILFLSRQTVSKLLQLARAEHIVEITVHHPQENCAYLSAQLEDRFHIPKAIVCPAGSQNGDLRLMHTVKAAAAYLAPLLEKGNQNIAVSWGRTVQSLISELPVLSTQGNTVFPLFGATDQDNSCFLSNELARSMADKIGAEVKYAWFPYLPDSETDRALLLNTSYFNRLHQLWETIDIAIVGIGNREIVDLFKNTLGYPGDLTNAVGDIATHFFTKTGKVLNIYKNTMCASAANIKNAKTTAAIACGSDKLDAIAGALHTGFIDTLITDEYTAKEILATHRPTHQKDFTGG